MATTTKAVTYPDGTIHDVTLTGTKPFASKQVGGHGGFGGTLGIVDTTGASAHMQLDDQAAQSVIANNHTGKAIVTAILTAFNA